MIDKIRAAGKSVGVELHSDELNEFSKRMDPAGILLWIAAEPKDQAAALDRIKHWWDDTMTIAFALVLLGGLFWGQAILMLGMGLGITIKAAS